MNPRTLASLSTLSSRTSGSTKGCVRGDKKSDRYTIDDTIPVPPFRYSSDDGLDKNRTGKRTDVYGRGAFRAHYRVRKTAEKNTR